MKRDELIFASSVVTALVLSIAIGIFAPKVKADDVPETSAIVSVSESDVPVIWGKTQVFESADGENSFIRLGLKSDGSVIWKGSQAE